MDKNKIIFNCLMFCVGIIMGALLFFPGCGKELPVEGSHTDTVFLKGPPIVNNYTFTNPTVYKERVIVYDSTRPNLTLTRADSDAIVLDYLKERLYKDSVSTDSSKVVYDAAVAKNQLIKMKISHTYTPSIMKITTTNNVYPNAILAGSEFSYYHYTQIPSFAPLVGFENKKYSYIAKYDILQKQAAVIIARRFSIRK